MPALAPFLERLLRQGEAVLDGPPDPNDAVDEGVRALLERAFARRQLELAGPRLDFDAPTALAAAVLLHHACWFLVNRQDRAETLTKLIRMPLKPTTPAQHWSADLTLSFAADIHRRSHGLDPADALTQALELVLRQWPLSGVLSSVVEPPLTPPDFDGHAGLQLLYAERLAARPRPGWVPLPGVGRQRAELAWHVLGRDAGELAVVAGTSLSADTKDFGS